MLPEGKAGTIGELLIEVERLKAAWKTDYRAPEEIWYRGQHCAEYPLLPLLYRSGLEKYHYCEASLMYRFQTLATPIVPHQPASEWEWYFLARHHGLPSRLLDWTESLLAAVYFALNQNAPTDRLMLDDRLQKSVALPCYKNDCPVVWILDAGSLNQVAIDDDTVIVPGGPRSAAYLPDALENSQKAAPNAAPIAILPPRGSERIAAQQGTFTIHGHQRTSIDALALADPRIRLAKVVLDGSRLDHLWNELGILGMHRLSLFPDLDTVSSHVCWICQSAI